MLLEALGLSLESLTMVWKINNANRTVLRTKSVSALSPERML